jgi:glycosyltransferase involved in cell wall biosynthesis
MKVLVDATSLLLRSAGVKNYTYYWLRELQKLAPGQFDAYPFLSTLGKLNHDGSNVSLFQTVPRIAALQFFNRVWPGGLEHVVRGYDFFHVSNQVKDPPFTKKCRITATVHDLTCWLLPETHTAANRAADQVFADRVLKRAHGLIAVSENTRQDAIRLLGIHPDRIRTIHSGVPDQFFDAVPSTRVKPYLLYAGTIEPRKNVDLLLKAYQAMRPDLRKNFDLVIAGPEGWRSESTMAALRSGSLAGVQYLGYVPEADMPGLFAAAAAFVYPSLYEGFGFPVAQAMAARVPVITSSTSCLPEVAGPGAVTVDPQSQAELTKAMESLLEAVALRAELGAKGRLHAESYRWRECAQKSFDWFAALYG